MSEHVQKCSTLWWKVFPLSDHEEWLFINQFAILRIKHVAIYKVGVKRKETTKKETTYPSLWITINIQNYFQYNYVCIVLMILNAH